MGIIQSLCCKDSPLEVGTEDEREESSRIWSENGISNHQYGSCLSPRQPIVYKIVLPKLIPVDIDLEEALPLDDSVTTNSNSSTSSTASSNQSQQNTTSTIITTPPRSSSQDDQINGGNKILSTQLVSPLTDDDDDGGPKTTQTRTPTLISIEEKKQKQKQPAVIKEEYCAEKFEHLRSLIMKNPNGQEQFKKLLWSCMPWSAPGGKSGSTFLKTVNDQFILKEMSKLELQSFLSIADDYFSYIEKSYHDNKPSLLSIIFGIYRIVYTDSTTKSSSEYYFMVMRNLFYKRNISQRFDLKGSVRNRLVNTDDPDNTEHVLMDENLLRITGEHPLFIHQSSKQILNECINSDSKFLTSISVMDYSLLVGVDKENQELVLGIIDYVRPFTWDKKIERVVKSVVSTELPTIVEPELYRERFCEAMDKYFESVPDTC